LNRPQRLNAITFQMYDELEETVAQMAADRTTRVVIITGAGRGFCAGQDLKELGADPSTSDLGPVQFGLAWQTRAAKLVRAMKSCPNR
jgi:enoyl-CoA hydratase/carnithine racemase